MSNSKCTICKTEIKGLYCYNCGQKASNKKASIFTIIGDFVSNIFSIENSFLVTFIAAITRPAFLVNNYYEGNKGVLIAPGKMVLFTSIILAFRFHYFQEPFAGASFGREQQEYILISLMLLFPILTSCIVFFNKKGILMRSIIAICYFSSFTLIVLSFIDLAFLLTNIKISALLFLVIYLFIFIFNSLVFVENKQWYRILGISFIQWIVMFIIITITSFILAYLYPESVVVTS